MPRGIRKPAGALRTGVGLCSLLLFAHCRDAPSPSSLANVRVADDSDGVGYYRSTSATTASRQLGCGLPSRPMTGNRLVNANDLSVVIIRGVSFGLSRIRRPSRQLGPYPVIQVLGHSLPNGEPSESLSERLEHLVILSVYMAADGIRFVKDGPSMPVELLPPA